VARPGEEEVVDLAYPLLHLRFCLSLGDLQVPIVSALLAVKASDLAITIEQSHGVITRHRW
jgi:hypothetical protein